jgi:hypothetical protein
MVEGRVTSVAEGPGEGALPIVTVRLAAPARDSPSWELLLAPRSVLDEIGFEIEKDDHLKARVFPAPGAVKVHKVLNLTRNKMVRLRALSRIPLWDGNGAWQGGECRGLYAPSAPADAAAGPPTQRGEARGAEG